MNFSNIIEIVVQEFDIDKFIELLSRIISIVWGLFISFIRI